VRHRRGHEEAQAPVASGGSGAQLVIALVSIAALGGLGFFIYQRFLAPR
jgi:hypothetical protein